MASISVRNGSYRIRVAVAANDSKITKSLTWRPDADMSKKEERLELDRIVSEFERSVNKGHFLNNITWKEYSDEWMDRYARRELRPRTVERYETLLKKINISIGRLKLLDIDPFHIRDFLDSLSRLGAREDIMYRAKVDVKQLLTNRKLRIKDVTDKTNISYTTMYQINHKKNVTYKNAKTLCDLIDVDLLDIFEPCEKLQRSLSGKTISHYYRLISLILKDATYDGLIPNNPANRVKPPKVKKPKIKYLNEEEANKLIKYLAKEDIILRTIVLTYLFSGCRRAELLGLSWDDVDFASSTISINKSLQYTPQLGLFIDETKTENSVRTISLPRFLIDLLLDYKDWQDSIEAYPDHSWDNINFVFRESSGAPVRPDRMSYIFRKFINKTDLPQINLHSLRHTSATLQIMGGVPIRAVADRLGHAKTSTTLDFYSHALKSGNEYGAEVLGKMIDTSPFES
jgi:integrase